MIRIAAAALELAIHNPVGIYQNLGCKTPYWQTAPLP